MALIIFKIQDPEIHLWRMKFTYTLLIFLLIAGCTQQQDLQPVEGSAQQDSIADTAEMMQPDTFDRQTSSVGQMVYVPVYSHIYQRDNQMTFNLTTTLSIRNADPYRSFTLSKVSYYDSEGNLIQNYLESAQRIKPLASTSFVVEEKDLRGGVGANFIINWQSETPISPPVIEAVNISTSQQQGISFLSVGRVLQEYNYSTNETGNN